MSFFPHLQYVGDLFLQNGTQPPRTMQHRLSRTDCIKTRAWQDIRHVLLLRGIRPATRSITFAVLQQCSTIEDSCATAGMPHAPAPHEDSAWGSSRCPAFEDDGFSAMSWSRASRLTPDTHACLSAQAAPVASRLPGSWPSHRVTVGRVKIDAGYGRYPTFTRHEQLACDAMSAWKPGAQGLEQTRPANGKPLGLIKSGNLRLTGDLNN